MTFEAQQIIATLGLVPLPREGGYYRATWVSSERLSSGRAAGSAIYFLITKDDFSAFHRLINEELWHFYAGDAVEHVRLDPQDGHATVTRLGSDILAGEKPQLVVRPGPWQAARLSGGVGRRGWALVACTLVPGWDETAFELGHRETLLRIFPQHATWVRELTR
jgi:predicted cupin superfamily sugar epimerase